ncbi:MAG: outer membrane protein transport protein [Deltaproteobacteria bacterium]|nr:outer membrane protein transport protein [Deltaproteobacteria bacterium]
MSTRAFTSAVGTSTFLVALAALVVASPSVASAQPMDTYGMGSRSIAMGGAVTADVEDFSANYYNPAGLARAGAARIGIGYFGAFHELQINQLDSNVDPARGLVLGLVVPGEIEGVRFAFGLGVHLNDDYISRTRSLPSRRPRWEFYDNRPRRTFLAAHLAIRPVDWLTIGGGISFLSFSTNTLSVRGELDVLMAERRSHLEHQILADLTTIRYPQVGVQVQPIPELSFGAVYRGQFALDSKLLAVVGCETPGDPFCSSGLNFTGFGDPFPGYFNLLSQAVNAFVPQQVSLGGSWSPTPDFRLNLEVTWVNWSAYVSPVGRSEIELTIEVPAALRDRIRVPDAIVGTTPQPALFEDRFVPRIGAEGTFFRERMVALRGRGGFYWEHSPVPNQMQLTNLADSDRFVFSAGLGMRLDDLRPLLPGFLQMDFHFQYSFLPDRTMTKGSLVDPVGDYRVGGQMFAGGVTFEVGFE